jgi:hypothetical protein
LLKNTVDFPYTVFTPPDRWGWRRNSAKLLSLIEGRLFILEKYKKEIRITRFGLEDIGYLERGKSLLYSWFNIHGPCQPSNAARIEFNTVVENLFSPIINQIREMANEGRDMPFKDTNANALNPELIMERKVERAKFDYLNRLNYKFMNFGKDSLLSGEQVNQIIYQPEIRRRKFRFFERYIGPAHIEILTDKELIVIKEDDRSKGRLTYGGIWNYIPLAQIISCAINYNEKDQCLTLALKITSGESVNLTYDFPQENTIKQFRDAIRGNQALS